MQGFAFAANVRNDGPHCSMVEDAPRSAMGRKPHCLVSCSEIRGPWSVFLANQVLGPLFLVKVVPRRRVRCLTKDLGPSAFIAITELEHNGDLVEARHGRHD